MRTMEDLQRLMVGDAIGKTAPVLVYRNGRTMTLELTPDELTVG